MSRPKLVETGPGASPSLADLLTTRPSGLQEPEAWAILCQAVQALQDLFLSDGGSGESCIPMVTPSTLLLSSRGRVKLCQSKAGSSCGPPSHLSGYLAPEYRPGKKCTDTEAEKMWIYALGESLKRATLTSHAATSRISTELCQVLTDMTKLQAASRASLMHLLDVIFDYCKRRQQNRPFSHIVMDLHQEAMAGIESSEAPWGPPAMPQLRPRTRNRSESNGEGFGTIPRRWMELTKKTKEASTSMEDINCNIYNEPGSVVRPKSMCLPDSRLYNKEFSFKKPFLSRCSETRRRIRRNPVQRAASRLYRAGDQSTRECIGPEFVVRASLPNKQLAMSDSKSNKTVMVILLNGQKLDVLCNPSTTTAGQLFELIIQKEHIEENFMLGISTLIAGDFVFLPSDTRICKAVQTGNTPGATLTLFMRVRFFLPSLRGLRGVQARHLLYLQLRRSILEHQLPCSFAQLMELNGLALQAEFGDFSEREHGARDYFLLDHYVPETMSSAIEDSKRLRQELIKTHKSRRGLDKEKAEQQFIAVAQTLPHYGGHFYTAVWMLKDNNHKDVWLYISAQGINLYERGSCTSASGPRLYEMFEWRSIQTLCYSKHYLCILPHPSTIQAAKLKKYKLKMDHKKSYFTFRLASLHHQFFLRLRSEYTSLHTLSQQFGIPLKDIKNEQNSLYKLEALTNYQAGSVGAETEFKIDFRGSNRSSHYEEVEAVKRSKSVNDFKQLCENEEVQNKENEKPNEKSGLVLESSCLAGFHIGDKRRGVKMGTRAFSNAGRVSRSMEAVNATAINNEYLEDLSLQSVSLHCSSNSIASPRSNEAYIIDETLKSTSNHFLPNFQETLSESLMEKLESMSFAEERVMVNVSLERDGQGSLGMQITEGSDGNVYIQSVILGGPAHLTGNVLKGDQVIAVDGKTLLGMKYNNALNFLKTRGEKVDFVLSRNISKRGIIENVKGKNLTNFNETHMFLPLEAAKNKLNESFKQINSNKHVILKPIPRKSPIEKHLTESCQDLSNFGKYGNRTHVEVPYHKHIRYEVQSELDYPMNKKALPKVESNLEKTVSKSCSQLGNSKAVIIEMIPKNDYKFLSLDRSFSTEKSANKKPVLPPAALPRSLGLSRKWRGPVRYPVTPVRKSVASSDAEDSSCTYMSNSDDEQIFI